MSWSFTSLGGFCCFVLFATELTNYLTLYISSFQFNVHLLHLYNLVATNDSHQHHVDDLKVKLNACERRVALLEKDFNRQSQDMQNL